MLTVCVDSGAQQNTLNAEAASDIMRQQFLHKPEERKLWAELDVDNSGFVSLDEFYPEDHDHDTGRSVSLDRRTPTISLRLLLLFGNIVRSHEILL